MGDEGKMFRLAARVQQCADELDPDHLGRTQRAIRAELRRIALELAGAGSGAAVAFVTFRRSGRFELVGQRRLVSFQWTPQRSVIDAGVRNIVLVANWSLDVEAALEIRQLLCDPSCDVLDLGNYEPQGSAWSIQANRNLVWTGQ